MEATERRIRLVTITGADDDTNPTGLAVLSREFPFVEWAILIGSHPGTPRFPGGPWLRRFAAVAEEAKLQVSMHLCGRPLRKALTGAAMFTSREFSGTIPDLFQVAQRVQLNTHGEPARWNAAAMLSMFRNEWHGKKVIIQIDGFDGPKILQSLWENDEGGTMEFLPFFDASHGAGLCPGEWPQAEVLDTPNPESHVDQYSLHGYAGGLGPDNLAAEIPRILAAAKNAPVWIDMETKVRTDGRLDLAKVKQCLEIAVPWVG